MCHHNQLPFFSMQLFLFSVNSLNLSLDLLFLHYEKDPPWIYCFYPSLTRSNLTVLELFDYTPHPSKKERSRTSKASN